MLIEFQTFMMPEGYENHLYDLKMSGITPIIAHPERYIFVQKNIKNIKNWINRGYVIQIDAGSIIGQFGDTIKNITHKIVDNGYFHLIDSWVKSDGERNVFKFKLVAIENVEDESQAEDFRDREVKRNRIIPSSVKREVWKRDKGMCVECKAKDELHFDHILPFSKGGTSLKVENVQLLCARHNLEKRAKIQ